VAHAFVDVLGDDIEIGGDDGHHLQRVRRLRVGEFITAADGTGQWRRYELRVASRGHIAASACGPLESEPELLPRIAVAISLTKGGLDATAARLTELGVHRIEPVHAHHSVVRWDDTRARAAVDRLRTVVREAAAQSRRARVPEVRAVGDIASLAGRPGLVVADRTGVPGSEIPDPPAGEWTLVIGPEGGLSADERVRLAGPRLAVGPHVLRAETAPIAACSALIGRARWSDFA